MSVTRLPNPRVRTRIKFCGMRRAEDAALAVSLGVDAIGFVCVRASKRYIEPSRAGMIRAQLPPFVTSVALLSNPTEEEVEAVLELLQPDYLQFHGSEEPEFCDSFRHRYIKAISMQLPEHAAEAAARYPGAAALLLDSHGSDGIGGTGAVFDWSRVPDELEHWMLAGGLNPENVAAAVTMARPYAVDVSSGIETAPGVKDPAKMRAFVAAVRRADHHPAK